MLIISILALAACTPVSVIPTPGEDDEPVIPGTPTGDEQTVSIAYLKTLYSGSSTLIVNELVISGVVISSDRAGNFHNTLVVQDDTGGIEIRIANDQLFKRFPLHSRVTVRCNALWLGSYGGTLQLGDEPYENTETEALSDTKAAEHTTVDEQFYGEMIARTTTFEALSVADVSTFVAFEQVQFAEQTTWGEEEADVNRYLVDSHGNRLAVRTSRYATFAAWPLPVEKGRIEGVLNVFNGEYQLVTLDSQCFFTR